MAIGTNSLAQSIAVLPPGKSEKDGRKKDGSYALSQEALPEYAGDYLILSKNSDTDNSFQETDTYKEIPAVKNKHVFEVNAKEFYFNDPLTLDYQLETFKKDFLGN